MEDKVPHLKVRKVKGVAHKSYEVLRPSILRAFEMAQAKLLIV